MWHVKCKQLYKVNKYNSHAAIHVTCANIKCEEKSHIYTNYKHLYTNMFIYTFRNIICHGLTIFKDNVKTNEYIFNIQIRNGSLQLKHSLQ